jgi:hypothetical protein
LLEFGPAVVASRQVGARATLDFVAYVGQLLAPPLLLGALAGALAGGRRALAFVLVALYAGAASGLAWDALRWETLPGGGPMRPRERAARAVRAAVFGCVWLAAVPAALWRLATRCGPVAYDKMSRDGVRS